MKMIKTLMLLLAPALVFAQTAIPANNAYSKFDFIPGEKLVYYNNFETDARGELPIGWNTTGSAEVVTMNNNNWVKLNQNAVFITDNNQSFSENFTIEFDLFLDFKDQGPFFPVVTVGVLSSGTARPNDNSLLQNILQTSAVAVDLQANVEHNSYTRLLSTDKGNEFFNSGEKPFKLLEEMLQKNIHVSIQVQQQRFRIWLNETKLYDVPQGLPAGVDMNQLFFRISESGYANEQIGIYVTNIKVAKGIPDTRNKLMNEGKFSTTGILFDVNSASIKPESYGIIKEIATVLKANSTQKILIVGHTDADGAEEDNLKLSKERSEAIKQLLVKEFTIPAANLTTDGKGETQPVADNRTKEGKAQNRRVEFIKL